MTNKTTNVTQHNKLVNIIVFQMRAGFQGGGSYTSKLQKKPQNPLGKQSEVTQELKRRL